MLEWVFFHAFVTPNKKINVFRVTGLKILGRVGRPQGGGGGGYSIFIHT